MNYLLALIPIALLLLGVAVLWLRTNKPIEGHTLIALGERHGVTVADLLVFIPLWQAWLLARQDSRVSALLNRR